MGCEISHRNIILLFLNNIYGWKRITSQILEYEWEGAMKNKMLNCSNEFVSNDVNERKLRREVDFYKALEYMTF